MNQEDPLKELFETLLENKNERFIINMIIRGKSVDEVIELLLEKYEGE